MAPQVQIPHMEVETSGDVPKRTESSSSADELQHGPSHKYKEDKVADWTPQEEKKLLLKFDLIILPLLTICFFCMQMDRGNIGNAVIDGLLEDVGISQSQYNVGQQLLYIGIVVLELPSNLILYRIGPRWWLGGQVVAFGLVEIFQSFQTNVGGFYASRLFLGLCEAGFIPASLYTLSMWYKRGETSKRFAIFYFGNLVSQGATSLLAYGIFQISPSSGRHGWQWMFIIEGVFTVLMGITLIALLPKDPSNPYPLSRLSYFSPAEREIMAKRVILDDPSKEKKSHTVSWKQVRSVLTTWRIYPHCLISMCGIAPVTTWLQYAPSLVAGFGYPQLKANAYVSIGPWLQIPVSLALGIAADKFRRRGYAILVAVLVIWGFVIGDLVVRNFESGRTKFAILTVTLAFSSTWQPINGAWLSVNAASPAERSVSLAMYIMSTNIGGIIGSQLFQESDFPEYTRGWGAILALCSVCVLSVIFANIQYRWFNRKSKHLVENVEEEVVNGKRVKFWL